MKGKTEDIREAARSAAWAVMQLCLEIEAETGSAAEWYKVKRALSIVAGDEEE